MGNKSKLAPIIISHMKPHDVYAEPFFGAGGLYFNKPIAKHNFLNDLDDDVYNLWQCYFYRKAELLEAVKVTPLSMSVFKHFMKCTPKDEIEKALRFLYLSNFSLYGKMITFRIGTHNCKEVLIKNFHSQHSTESVKFTCIDFRKFFSSVEWNKKDDDNRIMVYCDPPYAGTADNYSHSFTERDTIDLLDILHKTQKHYKNFYYMVSEFKSDFILYEAGKRGLHVTEVGERQSLKSRNTEIILTNYRTEKGLFD